MRLPIFLYVCSLISYLVQKTEALNNSNIIIIMADDMGRTQLYPYSENPVNLPNLRHLADSSTALKLNTVYSVCSPARQAFLTGVDHPNILTFDQNFFQLGYDSLFKILCDTKDMCYSGMFGKIMHEYKQDLKYQLFYKMNQTSVPRLPLTDGNNDCTRQNIGCVVPLERLSDTDVTKQSIKFIREAKQKIQAGIIKRFVLGVGYHKPHIDMASYVQTIKPKHLSMPNLRRPAAELNGNPEIDFFHFTDINPMTIQNKKILNGAIKNVDQITQSTATTLNIRALYFNSLYAVDHGVGKILRVVANQGLSDSTYILFLSDHGFNLGDSNSWGKNDMSPPVTQIPGFIAGPGINKGVITDSEISSIDILPTFIDLLHGTGTAKNFFHPSGMKLRGVSFVPVLSDNTAMTNQFVFFRYASCQPINQLRNNPCTSDDVNGSCDRPSMTYMGHGVVTKHNNRTCRYTAWWPFNEKRSACARPTWDNQPLALKDKYGVVSPQIDLINSKTNFNAAPYQPKLICHTFNAKYGSIDNPSFDNLALNPTKEDAALILEMQQAIKKRYS